MESIQGRDTDVVLTPSGNRLIVHFFTGILEHYHEIETFQVVQEKIDEIVLRLVPTSGFSKDTEVKLVSSLQEKAADLKFRIDIVDSIPLPPSGKRRFVISNISKPFVANN